MDEAIISSLRQDGRMSNRDLAKVVGVNEATVRTRIRRLEESDTMRVVAMIDLQAAGMTFLAAVGIEVKGRPVADVGADVAKIDQVMTVVVAIGLYDLEVQVVASSLEGLNTLLTDKISKVAGVARVTPGLSMQVLKYESHWVPFS